MPRFFNLLALAFAALVVTTASAAAQTGGWTRHVDPELGYSIELPVGGFERVDAGPPVTRLRQPETDTLLEVYGGYNTDDLNLEEFIDFLSRADRIAEITYRAAGQTWFVVSGYYQRETTSQRPLIFYAKFMFSPGLERFSAFEISYPQDHKKRLDPVVEALESSLRPPR